MNIKSIARLVSHKVQTNAPTILTSAGVIGIVATAVLAAKAAKHAAELDAVDPPRHLGAKEYVKWHWRLYLPAISVGAVSIASIVILHRVHLKRYSSLMGLVVLGERAIQEYKEAVSEEVDDKTAAKIRNKVAEKTMTRDAEAYSEQLAGVSASTLCVDQFSGRVFRSDIESIRRAENEFNKGLNDHQYGSLNEFYSLLNLMGIGAGENLGWNADKHMSIGYNAFLIDGVPALSIDFDDAPPSHNYYN